MWSSYWKIRSSINFDNLDESSKKSWRLFLEEADSLAIPLSSTLMEWYGLAAKSYENHSAERRSITEKIGRLKNLTDGATIDMKSGKIILKN